MPLFAEVRGADDREAPDLPPLQQFPRDEEGFDGLADAHVVCEQEPDSPALLERHDERDHLVASGAESELRRAADRAGGRAERAGRYACPEAGGGLGALVKLQARGEIRPHGRVVVISTAHGLKFTGFKVGYHDGSLEQVAARHANPPVELPADVGRVRRAIEERLR